MVYEVFLRRFRELVPGIPIKLDETLDFLASISPVEKIPKKMDICGSSLAAFSHNPVLSTGSTTGDRQNWKWPEVGREMKQ